MYCVLLNTYICVLKLDQHRQYTRKYVCFKNILQDNLKTQFSRCRWCLNGKNFEVTKTICIAKKQLYFKSILAST